MFISPPDPGDPCQNVNKEIQTCHCQNKRKNERERERERERRATRTTSLAILLTFLRVRIMPFCVYECVLAFIVDSAFGSELIKELHN